VFLTGSAAEITPVAEIQGMYFKPGKVTEQLLSDFSALVRRKNVAA
jgi:branched-chain amino acid aminotransferase